MWFVLGYALYAMVYGALGALASRTEDAQSVAAPVTYVLVAAFWASFMAISANPDSAWSQLLSLFPATAPLAMPGRIALGAAAWWEPLLAVALTLAAIAGLVVLAGRVYTGGVLHTGPRLKLRDAWRRATTVSPGEPSTGAVHTGTWPPTPSPDAEEVDGLQAGVTRRDDGWSMSSAGGRRRHGDDPDLLGRSHPCPSVT